MALLWTASTSATLIVSLYDTQIGEQGEGNYMPPFAHYEYMQCFIHWSTSAILLLCRARRKVQKPWWIAPMFCTLLVYCTWSSIDRSGCQGKTLVHILTTFSYADINCHAKWHATFGTEASFHKTSVIFQCYCMCWPKNDQTDSKMKFLN